MPATLIAFIIIFTAGVLLRFFNLLDKSHAERLAWFVFSFSLPATILVSLDGVQFAPTAWKIPLTACLITLPMVFIAWQLARLLQLPRQTRGGFLLATGCINSVYFAFPVILATLGDEGLAQAILFDLGQTTLTLTLLYALAVWHGADSGTPDVAVKRFLTSPPLWALAGILTVKLFGLRLPYWLRELLMPLHLTTTPLASLVLGLSISLGAVRRTFPLAPLAVVLRMGGGFLLGFVAVSLLALEGIERVVVLLVSGMPSAVTAVIFAAETRLDEELVASIVALSICLGVGILPWLPRLALVLVG
ncbi:AEC family transporter [Petrachloros mirabilis]